MVIFSYIFTFSIYEIYGLNNIGDSSLNEYEIKYETGADLLNVYHGLIEEGSVFQIIKNPMSEDTNTYYDIYHTNIDSVNKFVGIAENVYRYFYMTEDEFLDSNGYFYTNLSSAKIMSLSQKWGVEIKPVNKTNLPYFHLMVNNQLQFLILAITTLVIIYIYIIFRYKTNAVKKLAGFSSVRIIFINIKETAKIEGVLIGVLVLLYSIYFWINGKFSWMYAISFLLFLIVIGIVTILLLLLLQHCVRRIDIVDVLKNKVFSVKLYFVIYVVKIILIIGVTLVMNVAINYYGELDQVYKRVDQYKQLESLYSSHGRNADEYDKLFNNPLELEKTADNVKKMYLDHKDKAYVMSDTVRDDLSERFLEMMGLTRDEIMNDYYRNSLILNKNYIIDYTDIQLDWNFDESLPTILVPEKYKKSEDEIKESYKEMFYTRLNYNTRYGIEMDEVQVDEIQVIYIDNDLRYKVLSSLPYENMIDIELKNSVIMLDNGSFGSGFYYDLLGSSELAFKLDNRDKFKNMLTQYDLNNLYMTNTLLTPFESVISNYEFLLDHTKLFIFLFIIVLIFIIYISNYIDMVVNGKVYATKYVHGYRVVKNLWLNFVILFSLIVFSFSLFMLDVNITIYLLLITYDLVAMLILYKKLVVNQLDMVLNGGQ